jgi:O-antigen ligase
MKPLTRNEPLIAAGLAGVAAVLGTMAAVRPSLAVGLAALASITALPFLFPVAHLVTLVVILAAVPFGVQNQLGLGGGTGAIGVVLSDLLLAAGIFRALVVLSRARLSHGQAIAVLLALLYLCVVLVQLAHGIELGARVNEAGAEARTMLGYGVLLVALPVLRDPRQRRRLLRALTVAALLLGVWGLLQYTLSISYGAGGNFGVREGVQLTSGGRGQLLGGLFSFPVIVIVGFAALLSGHVRRRSDQAVLTLTVVLNAICLLLTFERTFWFVTVLGCLLVAARGGSRARWRAALLAPIVVILGLLPVAALSPDTLTTGRERLLSVGQYSSDRSVYYRLVESRHVLDEINHSPVTGSGLGAAIWWGRPLYRVPPARYTFVHNGYLYVAWKLGLVVAAALVAAMLLAVLRSSRRTEPPLWAAVVNGAQAALAALLVSNLTFPSLASLSATATIGLLLAICLMAPGVARSSRLAEADG